MTFVWHIPVKLGTDLCWTNSSEILQVVELNMPKAYGHYCCELRDDQFHINGLNFLKFITRTQVIEGLPSHYYEEVGVTPPPLLWGGGCHSSTTIVRRWVSLLHHYCKEIGVTLMGIKKVKSSMACSLPVENLLPQNVGSIINYLQ